MDIKTYKNKLNEMQQENLRNSAADHGYYDKALLYLASGSFVLSINYLKDVIGGESIFLPSLLIISWSLFTVSILTNLGSYRVSQYFTESRRQTVNDEMKRAVDTDVNDEMKACFFSKVNKQADKRTTHVKIYNEVATVAFGLAVLAMSIFASINVWCTSR